MQSIFVVDDEENMRFTISEYLVREGYRVETFASLQQVLVRSQTTFPDMFILDFALMSNGSRELCQDITTRSGLPVIFVSARDEARELITGVVGEGDDCLVKPFSPRELIARVRSKFRHAALPIIMDDLQTGNILINLNDRHITVESKEVLLTPMEYELLLLLARQPQRTFTRQELLDRVWGYEYVGSSRAVDDLVKRLRRKLRDSGTTKNVRTIWGYGYRFDE